MRTTTTMLVSIEAQRSSDQPMSSFVANEAAMRSSFHVTHRPD
jgi:hypothetical protein